MNCIVTIDGEEFELSRVALERDLSRDGFSLASLDSDGELIIRTAPNHYERWQGRPEGSGTNNSYWGDLPGGYEFCGSFTDSPEVEPAPKLSGYNGDKDIAEGGFYWRMESPDSDYADIVRIVPASDMGGPSNLFYLETGSLYLPGGDKEQGALDSCGWIEAGAQVEPWQRVDAMLNYWCLDSRQETVIQHGANDSFYDYDSPRGFGMPAIDRYISGRADLRGFVLAEYVSFAVEAR